MRFVIGTVPNVNVIESMKMKFKPQEFTDH